MFVWQKGTDARTKLAAAAFTALFFIGGLIFNTPFFFKPKVNHYEHAKASTMLVCSQDGYGSGVVVERRSTNGRRVFLWTAAHVVLPNPLAVQAKVLFHQPDGTKAGEGVFDAMLLGVSETDDIALYWVNVPDGLVEDVRFAGIEPVPIGDPIFHIGNFLGPNLDLSLTVGIISQHSIHPNLNGWFWILLDQMDLSVLPGGSGGGVFNADGKVIGLMVCGIGPTSITGFVPNRVIASWAAANGLSWAFDGEICPTDAVLFQCAAVARLEFEISHPPSVIILDIE